MLKIQNQLKPPAADPVAYVYFALFFVSGISGLIYESIWSQYLKQFLGHAAYAQTLVLVIFMGGMALGSWIASAAMLKYKNLLLCYAVVEIVLGLSALIFHDLFLIYLDASFEYIIPFLKLPVPVTLYRWISSAFIILPQAILLGATFPLMAGGILRRFPGTSGYKTSFIYFVNTFGASFGVLFSGFYLVRFWGLQGAIVTAGLIDLAVGVSILALCLCDKTLVIRPVGGNVVDDVADGVVDDNVISDDDKSVDDDDVINNKNFADDDKTAAANIISKNIITENVTDDESIDDDVINNKNVNDDNETAGAAVINNKNIAGDDPLENLPSVYDTTAIPHSAKDKKEFYHPLLFVAGMTAAASFIYEIGWIRILSHVLGSSTHSFEIMLSAFIFGIAVGSFLVRKKLDTMKNAPRFLGIVQVIMGATAIMTLFTYANMFHFMVFAIDGLDRTTEGYVFYNVISHLICMVIMLPSTICAGMVVPLIIHMLYKRGYGEQAIGKVYAINTAGGILGVAVTVWLLMELVGIKYVIIIGAAVDMGLGLYVMHKFRETRQSLAYTFARPAVVFTLVLAFAFGNWDPILASSGVFRYGSISRSKRIIEHVDGRTASITLFKSGSGRAYVLSTNGKPDASVGIDDEISGDEYTMALLGVLPLAVHENARTAAVIGMGAGMTSHFMLYDPDIKLLDVIEIEPAMVRLARRIGPRVENTFNDPRSRIQIEDAKTFFSAGSRRYDVIVSEPSNPWVSGVSSLFSKEFFERVSTHLNDDGILMQWFHMYEADMTILVSILKALEISFPVYEMYLVGSDLLIIAAKDEERDISIKRDVFEIPRMAQSLGNMGLTSLDDFEWLRFADHRFFSPYINSYATPPNSDFHSHVNIHASRHRFMGTGVSELTDIRDFVIPVRRIIFADTNFANLSPTAVIPDLMNIIMAQQAKIKLDELIESALNKKWVSTHTTAAFDFARVQPDRSSITNMQTSMIQILQWTLPYLSASEMRDLFRVFETQIGKVPLNEGELLWIAFVRALCTYDLPEIRRLSLELLPPGDIEDHMLNRMILASLFSSAAALEYDAGIRTAIERAWARYELRHRPPAPLRAALAIYESTFF